MTPAAPGGLLERDPSPRRGGVPGGVLRGARWPGARRRWTQGRGAARAGGESPHRRPASLPDRPGRSPAAGGASSERDGLEIVGYYHSHPDHPAGPSAFDTEHAWPWYSYLIVRVDRGRGRRGGQLGAGRRAAAHAARVTRSAQRGVTMSVTVTIPTPLRSFTGGRDAVELHRRHGRRGDRRPPLRRTAASSATWCRTTGGCGTSSTST